MEEEDRLEVVFIGYDSLSIYLKLDIFFCVEVVLSVY